MCSSSFFLSSVLHAVRLSSIIPDRSRAAVHRVEELPDHSAHTPDAIPYEQRCGDAAITEEIIVIPTEPTDSARSRPNRRGRASRSRTSPSRSRTRFRQVRRSNFRVPRTKSMLFVEVYGEYCEHSVPTPADVVATAERSVTDIDLTDERSIAGVSATQFCPRS